MTAETHEPPRIVNGIEWFTIQRADGSAEEDCQCARCGSSCDFRRCFNCDDGYSHHACGEDCCMCLNPENNVRCDWCRGAGGSYHCISGPEWCEANPLPGREHITSTALRAEAWNE